MLHRPSFTKLSLRIAAGAAIWMLCTVAGAHGTDTMVLQLAGPVGTCTALPDLGRRLNCYAGLCSAMDFTCAASLAAAATETSGPRSGIGVARDMMSLSTLQATADGHDIAHVVGRQTARHYGGTGQAFLLCPDTLFFGCHHGFFEGVLGESASALDAAVQICGDVTPDRRFFCFHGIGHGLMMAAGYDIHSALSTCDLLPTRMAREACWQGTFMENENAFSRGEARSGVFDPSDPMAPCNRLGSGYRYQCYAQHGGYLLSAFSGSMKLAAAACADTGRPDAVACIRHLGQHASARGTQEFVYGDFDRQRFAENAATLCQQTPRDYVQECLFAAAQNFMFYDYVDDAARFCALLGPESTGCVRHLMSTVNVEGYPAWKRQRFCSRLEPRHKHLCDIRTLSLASTLERMRHDLLLLDDTAQAFVASASTVIAVETAEAPPDAGTVVRYAASGFAPDPVIIRVGNSVLWNNETGEPMWIASDDHPTHEKYGDFDPHKPSAIDASWSFSFAQPGNWTYHDHLHPTATGTVLVLP